MLVRSRGVLQQHVKNEHEQRKRKGDDGGWGAEFGSDRYVAGASCGGKGDLAHNMTRPPRYEQEKTSSTGTYWYHTSWYHGQVRENGMENGWFNFPLFL